MAQSIILKRSATSGKVPTTSSLSLGELAINTYDGKIFLKKSGSIESIQTIVTTDSITTGSVSLSGDLTVLGSINARQFNIGIISSSILYQSGSNKFGDTSDDTHQFTGSLNLTGSISMSGDLVFSPVNTYQIGSPTQYPTVITTSTSRAAIFRPLTTSGFQYRSFDNINVIGQWFNNGNLSIQSGSALTDNGYRLSVNGIGNSGSLLVSGSSNFIGNIIQTGSTTITGSLVIANSTNPAQKNTLSTDTNGYLSFQNVVYQTGIGAQTGYVNLFQNYITVSTGSGYMFSANGNSGAGTQDVGIRRLTAGTIEIFNGTGDTSISNRRDLVLRNITGSNASFSGSVSVTGSFLVNGAAVGVAPGPNTYDFNLDPSAAGTVNYIQDSTGNSFVIAQTGSIDIKINNSTFLSVSQSAINVTTGSITANYMHLAKYINTAGDLDFNI
jgi:hypothetical protein